ncbi:insulinase family protein [Alkalibacter rhizosphaerae]|uniref:Insulinase family protein n=1 Tax=Alkalibacter rhizosphaerae TaxID=2815577 RepID=A0A975AHP9_9FIRM|nr:insulinase family protein [Alkalibacter rhizosphaerae]QSX08677.1 insulinase family protein [Alkalibacter rhizosphaerae]
MELTTAQRYEGFVLISKNWIEENRSTGFLFEHEKTGARLFYLSNDDENKVFSITFKTPPADSTGLPHILEHSVLCGSRKYPVKEPFVELMKSSMNTFLNAMTFPDKTMYPVASMNERDFMNLMDVYLDAVFYPRIYDSPEIFYQEGWHYHLEELEDPIAYNGVVYNEMKGAFSNPEDVLGRRIQEILFPETAYGNESGGDPEVIPKLTYEDFLQFHKTYYHPSNSYIYLYGNGDVLKHLAYLNEAYLKDFEPIEDAGDIGIQPPFEKPIKVMKTYPIGEGEEAKDKTYLSMSFVTHRCTDGEKHLALDMLTHILSDAPSSPINKALLETGICKDVEGHYDGSILQPVVSILAKNANEGDEVLFEKTIRDTLESLVREGLDKDMVQGAINYTEFKLREADHGSYPKGLIYNMEIMESWLHGEDPSIHLEFQGYLDRIKAEADNGYFEELIQTHLLDNPHVATVVLLPEKGLSAKKDEEVALELEKLKNSLSQEALEQMQKDTLHLLEVQNTPDSQEDIDKMPVLPITDIRRTIEPIPMEVEEADGVQWIHHPIATNGINYIRLYFDVDHIPVEDLGYLSLLTHYIGEAGTHAYDYVKLNHAIEMHTGGIDLDIDIFGDAKALDVFRPKLVVKARVLEEKTTRLFELLKEMLLRTRMDEKQRLKEVLQSTKSKAEMDFMTVGHKIVSGRVMSYLSNTSKYAEQIGGLDFFRFISRLDANFEESWENIFENMERVATSVFDAGRLRISHTGSREGLSLVEKEMKDFLPLLGNKPAQNADLTFALAPKNEGIATPGKVLYVGKAYNIAALGHKYDASLQVVKTIMSTDYLWNKVRVQGGAYGAFFSVGRTGSLFMGSYRDPNLKNTLDVFDRAGEYLKNFKADRSTMDKYIIGTMSGLDTPMTPNMKGAFATGNLFRNVDDALLQKERLAILECSVEDVVGAAEIVEDAMKQNHFCVLGDEQKIKKEKDLFGEIIQVFEE